MSYRFNTIVIDGHNVEDIIKALETAEVVKGKPTAIIAKTFKGKGLPGKCIVTLFEVFGNSTLQTRI